MSALDIGALIAPSGWQRTVLVVIGGYIDGSNLHPSARLVAVAGCAASTSQWPVWQAKWKELLDFSGLPKWHHTDFMNHLKRLPGGRVVSWIEGEWLIARRMLCEAFEAIRPVCFGATVWKADYDELRQRYPSLLPEDSYYFLLDRTLHRLIQGLFEHPVDDGVAIYCDQDKDEALVRSLAGWHTAYLRADPTDFHRFYPDRPQRKVVTSYGSNIDYVPLQAADVIAHEVMRFARSNPDIPFIATNRQSSSWILDRLKGRFPWMMVCYQKSFLEMELDGRAFEPAHWPGFRFGAPPPDEE